MTRKKSARQKASRKASRKAFRQKAAKAAQQAARQTATDPHEPVPVACQAEASGLEHWQQRMGQVNVFGDLETLLHTLEKSPATARRSLDFACAASLALGRAIELERSGQRGLLDRVIARLEPLPGQDEAAPAAH